MYFFGFGGVHSVRSSACNLLLCRRAHACSPNTAVTSAAACCLVINLPPDCAAAVHSAAFWRRQQADDLCFQLPSHDLLLTHVLRRRRRICFCVLRSSMLSTAAQRRFMVTPIRCLESRKCSFPLHLLLLFLWCHKQSCSAPRDMSIGTLTLLYLGRSWSAHGPPPKMYDSRT